MHLRTRAGGRRGRGPAARRRRHRGDAGERESESRRRQPDGVSSSAIRSPEARRLVCGFSQEWPSSASVWSVFLTFGTGWWHKPVPKVHWYRLVITTGTKGPPKIVREPLYLWYRFFSQTGTKGFFSLFLFLFY